MSRTIITISFIMQAADCLYLITMTLFSPVYIHLCSVTIAYVLAL